MSAIARATSSSLAAAAARPAGQGWPAGHCSLPASSRSTYLAIMSTSRFTTSPGCLRPSVVRCSVSGIRLTSNQCAPASLAERRDRQADAVDGHRALLHHVTRQPGGSEMRTTSQPVAGLPGQDACPCRRRGPARCDRRAGRRAAPAAPGSRPRPAPEGPRLERSRVSPITSALNWPSAAAGDRQADAVDGDRVAAGCIGRDQRPANGQPGRVASSLDADNLAEFFHDPGKHRVLLRSPVRWGTALPRAPGTAPSANARSGSDGARRPGLAVPRTCCLPSGL